MGIIVQHTNAFKQCNVTACFYTIHEQSLCAFVSLHIEKSLHLNKCKLEKTNLRNACMEFIKLFIEHIDSLNLSLIQHYQLYP